MAIAEDAATVLEEFVQDVANFPAEIAHLLEEIQAKDKLLQDCRNAIIERDNSLQKFIRANGSHVANPKEDIYGKAITTHYDQARALQDEKIGLTDKASMILDRQIRRLDYKIRDLTRQGIMPKDPTLPSILHSGTGDGITSDMPTPNAGTGTSTPLNPLSHNVMPSTTIANSSIARLAHPQPQSNRGGGFAASAGSQMNINQPHRPLLNAPHLTNSAPATPASSATGHLQLHQRQRESSAGAINDAKRRRLINAHLGSLPSTSSALARQSSLGPGTPKAGTPLGTRGGSAGPRAGPNKKDGSANGDKKQVIRKKAAGGRAGSVSTNNKRSTKKNAEDEDNALNGSESERGRHNNNNNNNNNNNSNNGGNSTITLPSTASGGAVTGNPSDPDEEMHDGSTTQRKTNKRKHRLISRTSHTPSASEPDDDDEVEEDEEDEVEGEEEGTDNKRYCTCHNVSYGNMVGCDNPTCPYEWFHWHCVGLTKEPIGTWFCPECSRGMQGGGGGVDTGEGGDVVVQEAGTVGAA